jgi:hypothetical protein
VKTLGGREKKRKKEEKKHRVAALFSNASSFGVTL